MKDALLTIGKFAADPEVALGSSKNEEHLRVLGWIEFGLNVVKPGLRDSQNFNELVLAPLQDALALSTFLSGAHKPSLADWFVGGLLVPRLRLMIPNQVQRYFRVFRWTAHVDALCQMASTAKSALSTSPFDMTKMMAVNWMFF